jgi:hypothetical protein
MTQTSNPTTSTRCPVCGRPFADGETECPNATHPVAGPYHRSLAMSLDPEAVG